MRIAFDPDRPQEPTACPKSGIVWLTWDKLAPLVLDANRVPGPFGYPKLRADTKGASISTVTLTLRKRPFLTQGQAVAVSEEAQFHGRSSSSRLIGWPLDMRSSTSLR
jgi:hypothetical protein